MFADHFQTSLFVQTAVLGKSVKVHIFVLPKQLYACERNVVFQKTEDVQTLLEILVTCMASPSALLLFLPSEVHGAGVGSSRCMRYRQTRNPD